MGRSQHALPQQVYEMATHRRSDSGPRWERSRRSSWRWSSGYPLVSRRKLPDSCIPGSSPMRRCASRGYSVCLVVVVGTRSQRRKEMLLEDKYSVIYSKCNQCA
jgi:hypothetical protein